MHEWVDLQWVRPGQEDHSVASQSQLSRLGSYTKEDSQNAFERVDQSGKESQVRQAATDWILGLGNEFGPGECELRGGSGGARTY